MFASGHGEMRTQTPYTVMTQNNTKLRSTNHEARAIATWEDEGGAVRRVFSEKPSDTTWFVPPIVVPTFLATLLVASAVYQAYS